MKTTIIACCYLTLLVLLLTGCSSNDQNTNGIDEVVEGDKIDKIADEHLATYVFMGILGELDNEIDDLKKVAALSQPQQTIFVIWLLESEVNNGGFDQFYNNTSGAYARMVPKALERIGTHKFADLVSNVNDFTESVTVNKAIDPEFIFDTAAYNSKMDQFDRTFYKLYAEEDLTALQVKFIRNNKAAFINKEP